MLTGSDPSLQPDQEFSMIIPLINRYLKNNEWCLPKYRKDLRKLSKQLAVLYGPIIGDALGAPFEFSPLVYPPPPIGRPLNMMGEGGVVGWRQAGQWTDDGSQALCLIMAHLYAREARNRLKEQPLNPQEFENLFSNIFAYLLYQWYQRGFNTGFTEEQWIGRNEAQGIHSIGCGGITLKFEDWWEQVKKFTQSQSKGAFDLRTFWTTWDPKAPFAANIAALSKQQFFYKDGNASTMRNVPVFAENVEEAMRFADIQSRGTTPGGDENEASACAQLQAFLTYQAINDDEFADLSPKECKEKLFSQAYLKKFLQVYQVVNGEEAPSRMIALCLNTRDINTTTEDTSWLIWRKEDGQYQTRADEPRDYYGSYATCGIALIFNAIYTTNSYEEALRKLALAGGDSDSNCAAAACILGAIYGYENIPERWLKSINQYNLNAGTKKLPKQPEVVKPTPQGVVSPPEGVKAPESLLPSEPKPTVSVEEEQEKAASPLKEDTFPLSATNHAGTTPDKIPFIEKDPLIEHVLTVTSPDNVPPTEVKVGHLADKALRSIAPELYDIALKLESTREYRNMVLGLQNIDSHKLAVATHPSPKIRTRNAIAMAKLDDPTFQHPDIWRACLRLLKDMNDETSNVTKNLLAQKILQTKQPVHVFNESSKFDSNFIKKLTEGKGDTIFISYENLMANEKPEQRNIYADPKDFCILQWKLMFDHSTAKIRADYFNPMALDNQRILIDYLSTLENDTSEEALLFKQQAMSFLLVGPDRWKDEKFRNKSLNEIISMQIPNAQLITNFEKELMLKNRMVIRHSIGPLVVYERLVEIFRKRVETNHPIYVKLTGPEKNQTLFNLQYDGRYYFHPTKAEVKQFNDEVKDRRLLNASVKEALGQIEQAINPDESHHGIISLIRGKMSEEEQKTVDDTEFSNIVKELLPADEIKNLESMKQKGKKAQENVDKNVDKLEEEERREEQRRERHFQKFFEFIQLEWNEKEPDSNRIIGRMMNYLGKEVPANQANKETIKNLISMTDGELVKNISQKNLSEALQNWEEIEPTAIDIPVIGKGGRGFIPLDSFIEWLKTFHNAEDVKLVSVNDDEVTLEVLHKKPFGGIPTEYDLNPDGSVLRTSELRIKHFKKNLDALNAIELPKPLQQSSSLFGFMVSSNNINFTIKGYDHCLSAFDIKRFKANTENKENRPGSDILNLDPAAAGDLKVQPPQEIPFDDADVIKQQPPPSNQGEGEAPLQNKDQIVQAIDDVNDYLTNQMSEHDFSAERELRRFVWQKILLEIQKVIQNAEYLPKLYGCVGDEKVRNALIKDHKRRDIEQLNQFIMKEAKHFRGWDQKFTFSKKLNEDPTLSKYFKALRSLTVALTNHGVTDNFDLSFVKDEIQKNLALYNQLAHIDHAKKLRNDVFSMPFFNKKLEKKLEEFYLDNKITNEIALYQRHREISLSEKENTLFPNFEKPATIKTKKGKIIPFQ